MPEVHETYGELGAGRLPSQSELDLFFVTYFPPLGCVLTIYYPLEWFNYISSETYKKGTSLFSVQTLINKYTTGAVVLTFAFLMQNQSGGKKFSQTHFV